MRNIILLSLAFGLALTQSSESKHRSPATTPRLVVQIIVDQLAASILTRQADRFMAGGFNRLMKGGAWFPKVRLSHAHTETVVGHSTLVTGAYPSSHGMIGNSWYSLGARGNLKAFESGAKQLCGRDASGYSPEQLAVATIGDNLHEASKGRAKVFSISGKARSGVAMGGKKGKAFWYDGEAKGFVTSDYYFRDCPAWVVTWHARDSEVPIIDRYQGQQWKLSRSPTAANYSFDGGNQFEENSQAEFNMMMLDNMKFGRTFPHEYGTGTAYYRFLTGAPGMDELIADFALEIIREESLGQDEVPDYLGISFSANDAVLHNFGPATRESEDVIFRLDRTLARLLTALDEMLGMDNVLIVISSDHGGPEYPVVSRTRDGFQAQWIPKGATKKAVEAALHAMIWPRALVASYNQPYVYLDPAWIKRLTLDQDEVLDVIEEAVRGIRGVKTVVRTADRSGNSGDALTLRILRNQYPGRSGDLYVVRNQYWQQKSSPFGAFDLLQHGSPWDYDSFVPLGFFGPGVSVGVYDREGVRNVDVLPTLADFLHTTPGGKVAGTKLPEVFANRP